VRPVVEVVVSPLHPRRAAEVVERERRLAALREAQRQILAEAVESAHVREDHDTLPDVASGVARNAAKRLPSRASSTRSSCETAAPERTGIGGTESDSKHTAEAESRVSPVREALLAWYCEGGRELPWRKTRDPYAILVSEVMLQQTQASRVVPRWLAWLERWPSAEALADAPAGDVIREWQGLGYNRRALSLLRAAKVVAEFGWPDDLTRLPGVGRYTADAVACFAFERPVLPVDVNVRRVQERTGARFDHACAQALMDLGATVCIARVPRCGECPLAAACPSRGRRFEPLRKQSPFEGSFRQRRALTLRLVAKRPRPLVALDADAVRALERDELVLVEDELVRLPT